MVDGEKSFSPAYLDEDKVCLTANEMANATHYINIQYLDNVASFFQDQDETEQGSDSVLLERDQQTEGKDSRSSEASEVEEEDEEEDGEGMPLSISE